MAADHRCTKLLASLAVGGSVLAVLWWRRCRSPRTTKKIKVYCGRLCRSVKVAWTVEELGINDDFEFIHYDPHAASEEEREWHRSHVHPHGTVPALVDENTGKVMLESTAMCMYLAELHRRLLPPSDMLDQYLDWCVYVPVTAEVNFQTMVDSKMKPGSVDASKLEEAFRKADIFVRRLDEHLDNRNYICGSKFTVADIVVGYLVQWASIIKAGETIADYPNVKSYLERLQTRPAYVKTVGTDRDYMQLLTEYGVESLARADFV